MWLGWTETACLTSYGSGRPSDLFVDEYRRNDHFPIGNVKFNIDSVSKENIVILCLNMNAMDVMLALPVQ